MPRLCLSLLLSLVFASAASAVAIDWATVGAPGNTCDPQVAGCYGAVASGYRIATHEVINAQYAEFLNAVAGTTRTRCTARTARSPDAKTCRWISSTSATRCVS